MGPMPWTINSEIYPMWARSFGNSMSTSVCWAFNLLVSMTFLSLTEAITKQVNYKHSWIKLNETILWLITVRIWIMNIGIAHTNWNGRHLDVWYSAGSLAERSRASIVTFWLWSGSQVRILVKLICLLQHVVINTHEDICNNFFKWRHLNKYCHNINIA